MISLPPLRDGDEQLLQRFARLKEQNEDFRYFLEWLKDNGNELQKAAIEYRECDLKQAYSGAALYNNHLVEQIENSRSTWEKIQESKKKKFKREGT